jgi:hypothetical protein
MVVKRGKPIGYRTSNECNSWFFGDLGGELTTARKRKKMTKQMTLSTLWKIRRPVVRDGLTDA